MTLRAFLTVAVAVGAVGCAEYRLTETTTLDVGDIGRFRADVDVGDVSYFGELTDQFAVNRTSWGRGSFKSRAERRADERNTFGIAPTDDELLVWSTTDRGRAGVDWAVVGPELVDVDVFTGDGLVDVSFVEGTHLVTASGITGQRVIGDVDFYARAFGVDVEVWPYLDGTVRIQSDGGDVYLALPFGYDYDVQVYTDPEYGASVTDLGFDNLYVGVDYVSARRGRGDILIDVFVSGGLFTLLESR